MNACFGTLHDKVEFVSLEGKHDKVDVATLSNNRDTEIIYSLIVAVPKSIEVGTLKYVYADQKMLMENKTEAA